MKRAASLFLVAVHLSNIFGCPGLFFGWEAFNIEGVHSDLDSDIYAGSEALTLRIPFSLPYASNHHNYERVNGSFEYEGAMYRMVKQKLYNDTLYIICSRDEVGTYIKDTIQDLAHSMNEQPSSNTASSGKAWSSVFKDFEISKHLDISPSLTTLRIIDFYQHASNYSYFYGNSIDHPPSLG